MVDVEIREPSGDFDLPERKARKVHELLSSGRRHFGRPGSNLTLLDDSDVKSTLPDKWKCDELTENMKACENASNAFMDWMQDKPNAVLVDSVHVDGMELSVDDETGLMDVGVNSHVIIIGSHVLIVDTKYVKSGKDEDHIVNFIQDDDGNICRGSRIIPGGHVDLDADLRAWFSYLQSNQETEPLNLLGMIYLDADYIKVNRFKSWWETLKTKFWYLIEKDKFTEQMDKWYEQIPEDERAFISTDIVTQIVMKMCKPYDRRAHVINMKPLMTHK